MKKIYIPGAFCLALLLASCSNKDAKTVDAHNHDTHAHSHEGHTHGPECKGHDHDHNHADGAHTHDGHAHGEECSGHDHDHDHDHGSPAHTDEIIFPVEKAKAAGVKVETIQPATFNQVIPASGQILTAQGDETTVVANVSGVVSFKKAVTDGMSVSKGTPLVVLSSKNLLDGDPAYRARVAYETAKKEYERAKGLVESQIVSEREFNAIKQDYENARIAYSAIAKNQTSEGQIVSAPMAGYVKSILVSEGDYVEVGQPLVSITQNRRLYLRAEVSERYYKYLKNITSANFKTPYDDQVYNLAELKGRILSYGKASGETSFYVPVTFEFDNKGDILPGSYVNVYLMSSPMQNVMVLPRTALTEEQGLYFIYLQLDEEGYKKQEVKLGADNGREVQILSGIHPGDRVVTEGAYHVKLATASNALPAHSHEH